jgi:hypothetical protein
MVEEKLDNVKESNKSIAYKLENKKKKYKSRWECLCFLDESKHLIESVFGKTALDIQKKTRVKRIVQCRHAVFYALNSLNFSKTSIGWAFDRDHSTIIHGLESIVGVMDLVNDGYAAPEDREWVVKAKWLARKFKQKKDYDNV